MVLHWREFFKFFKNNITKIIIGTITIAVLFVLFINFSNSLGKDKMEVENMSEGNIEVTEDLESLTVTSMPAYFQFYVDFDDGRAFTNNLLIEQYLLLTEVLEEISSTVDTSLTKIIERTNNEIGVEYNESGESKVLQVPKNNNTHVMEVYVNMGDEEKNIEIAEYIYNEITSGEIDFLANKNVYILQTPKLFEPNHLDSSTIIAGTKPAEEPSYIGNQNYLGQIIIGILLGLFLTIFLLLVTSFFSKKLRYSFSYYVRPKDDFILIDNNTSNLEKAYLQLKNPKEDNQVIIQERGQNLSEPLSKINETTSSFKIFNSILEINMPQSVQRYIYIIAEGETSRSWYSQQRKLDEIYEVPTTIIQLNENID